MLRSAAALLLLLAIPLRANLGENITECTKRYGKFYNYTEANAKTPFGTIVFIAGPYEMIVFVYDGVEVGARVSKNDKTDLSPAEIKTILYADAPSAWIPVASDDPASQVWKRADKATATYDTAARMVIFTTPVMELALHSPAPTPAAPSTNAAPLPPRGKFAPAGPTTWAPPIPPSTNVAPATTTGPMPQP